MSKVRFLACYRKHKKEFRTLKAAKRFLKKEIFPFVKTYIEKVIFVEKIEEK